MFSLSDWLRRDLGFRTLIRAGRTIMLSSKTACDDLERFYPSARGRGHVVRFAIDLDTAAFVARGSEMRALYKLPEHYFFMPNQFWRHKNHGVILAALARLKAEGRLAEVPPVILTGQAKDPRSPTYFDDLMTEAKSSGVDCHFRYLGLIPYDHVISLNAACHAMINPSRFEGWSTPIEEAKSLATLLLLSDIPIHREQAPGAQFFDPLSPDAAARVLLDCARAPVGPRPPLQALVAAQVERLDEHGRALLEIVRAAVASQGLAAL
jgi:glycosyltransferase involved in cell wall biosynthesis